MKTPLYDDKWIVITGACGFIGSCLVRHLNDLGFYNLLLVDDFDSGPKWKNLVGKRFEDVISIHELFEFLEGKEQQIEAIVHLGACSDTTEMNSAFLYENNYRFSVKLCQYALTHGHRFIYASSAATYGLGEQGFSDDEALLDSLRPLNPYAFSKHLFDLWAKRQDVLKQIVSIKYFNIFGPNESHKGHMSSMIYKMVPKILATGKIELFKSNDPQYQDGEQVRDFLYVKEAVAMTAAFLSNQVCGVYNIGSGVPTTWNTLASTLFSALGKPIHIEYIPIPTEISNAYQNFTLADMSKFKKGVVYTPRFDLEASVKDYVLNHLLPHKGW